MRRSLSARTQLNTALTEFREQILQVKMFSQDSTNSLKTQLATFMITFVYPREAAYWRELASSGVITNHDGQTFALNKLQRYNCIRRLAMWGHEYVDLLAAEFATNYSDSDEHAKLRIEAADTSLESKQALWDSYLVPDRWKQSYFASSVSNLLNFHERDDCLHFA